MTTRRSLIAALAATAAAAAVPGVGWAEAGAPAWLSCARAADGTFALFGLRIDGSLAFRIPLPARGHAGARHPARPLALVMARRPGIWALAIDCVTGAIRARLSPPGGVHFNGHAAFLDGGAVLATAEQRIDDSAGQVGLWDVRAWQRIGTWATGGIGPHEVALLPDGRLAVANGGIATDPTDRTKLNLGAMQPSLSILRADGGVDDIIDLPRLRRNSIRHLAVRADGTIAFAMQWEGDTADAVPLLGLVRPGTAPVLAETTAAEGLRMQGYAGSVAWSGDGMRVAITSPRGGRMQIFNPAGRFIEAFARPDICGLAPRGTGFVASDGGGALLGIGADGPAALARHGVAWDNHLIPV